ncbi:hypothetical protein GE09DRAFT_158712 [Coniochaeta sp. 2T2.1]|nr:hypothetical protein GE09DRAFT_158712 [Coniochaeta sp. 2T2.1]
MLWTWASLGMLGSRILASSNSPRNIEQSHLSLGEVDFLGRHVDDAHLLVLSSLSCSRAIRYCGLGQCKDSNSDSATLPG